MIELKNRNKYGYTVLACRIDFSRQTATLYHGQTAPISGDWKKASRAHIRDTFTKFSKLPGWTATEE